jgi:hypothetical protein
MDEEPMRRMSLRELQEAEILKSEGTRKMEQINDAVGLEELPSGGLFQDKYGYLWQKNSIQTKDIGHGRPVDIYNLMGSPTIAAANQVLDFTPLTVVMKKLPVEPRSRILPRGTVIPWTVWHALGVENQDELASIEARLERMSDR